MAEEGLTLSGRCPVTLSMMFSVSQAETSGLWFLRLFETDSASASCNLEQTLKLELGRCGGEADMSDSLVGTSTKGCGLGWMYAGTDGGVKSGRGAGRCTGRVLCRGGWKRPGGTTAGGTTAGGTTAGGIFVAVML